MDFSQAQFEGNAAPIGAQCGVCQQPLTTQYWSANGITVCGNCAAQVQAEPPSEGAFLRVFKAVLFGSGAGLLGAIGYGAVIFFTHYELALITIGIGWMVGRAVKAGSEGRGGRGYQVLGAFLTYVFCMMAYVPDAVKGMTENGEQSMPFIAAALIAPFVVQIIPLTGGMGILGTLILAFGVYQGWKEPTKPVITVEGPFSLAQEPAPVAAAAP